MSERSYFKVGDTVYLQSGGLKMTIEEIVSKEAAPNLCRCKYYYDGEVRKAEFSEPMLRY